MCRLYSCVVATLASTLAARLAFHRKSQKGGTAFYKSTWLKCHLNCDELRSVYLSIYLSTL